MCRGRAVRRTDISVDAIGLVGRHIQPVAGGVHDLQVVAGHALLLDSPDSSISADAVLDMHYVVARREVGEETLLGGGPATRCSRRSPPAE